MLFHINSLCDIHILSVYISYRSESPTVNFNYLKWIKIRMLYFDSPHFVSLLLVSARGLNMFLIEIWCLAVWGKSSETQTNICTVEIATRLIISVIARSHTPSPFNKYILINHKYWEKFSFYRHEFYKSSSFQFEFCDLHYIRSTSVGLSVRTYGRSIQTETKILYYIIRA